jgi:hypothetical protein
MSKYVNERVSETIFQSTQPMHALLCFPSSSTTQSTKTSIRYLNPYPTFTSIPALGHCTSLTIRSVTHIQFPLLLTNRPAGKRVVLPPQTYSCYTLVLLFCLNMTFEIGSTKLRPTVVTIFPFCS